MRHREGDPTDTYTTYAVTTSDLKLHNHLKLCIRNLKSDRVKCCAHCPFESIITQAKPELTPLFRGKRGH